MIDEGSKIIEEVLRAWAARSPEKDGDDVVMGDDDTADAEVTNLRACVDEYKDRIAGNPWIQSLLAAL